MFGLERGGVRVDGWYLLLFGGIKSDLSHNGRMFSVRAGVSFAAWVSGARWLWLVFRVCSCFRNVSRGSLGTKVPTRGRSGFNSIQFNSGLGFSEEVIQPICEAERILPTWKTKKNETLDLRWTFRFFIIFLFVFYSFLFFIICQVSL